MRNHARIAHLFAAAASIGLALWPGVGFFQAALTGCLIITVDRCWGLAHAAAAQNPSRPRWFVRVMTTLLWAALAALPAVAPLLFADQVDGGVYVRGPELLWLLASIPTAAGVALLFALGRASVATVVQGLILGAVTAACWVPIGRATGLDDALRFHPVATFVLAAVTLVLTGARMLLERGPGDAARWLALYFAQSLGLGVYLLSGSIDTPSKLGNIPNESISVLPGGRLRAELVERDSAVMVYIVDSTLGERVYVTSIFGPHAGREFDWTDGAFEVQWFAPADTRMDSCGQEPSFRSDFWLSQERTVRFELCRDAENPIGCRIGRRSRGSRCERDRECATQRCEAEVCVGSDIGETCVNDEGCDEGTCVGRVCRLRAEVCDSNGDCPRYCHREAGATFGQCYSGDPGDPCDEPRECLNSTCTRGFCARDGG